MVLSSPQDLWLVLAHFLCPQQSLCPLTYHSLTSSQPHSLLTYSDSFCYATRIPFPQVFGIILVSVFAYDAFKIYRTELMPRATEGECLP